MQFNSRLQPTQIGLGTSATDTGLLKLNYDYGTTQNNGNVLSQTITVNRSNQSPLVFNQTYTYDSLNRLKQAVEMTGTTQNWKQTYIFDRYGNRQFDVSNNNTTTLPQNFNANIYNPSVDTANNRFTSGQGYTYDLSGNLLTDAEGRSFSYDGESKQKTAANTGGTIGQYFYDGDSKRVKKITNTEIVIFVYDASGRIVAEYSTQLSQTPQTQYLTSDYLGTPRIITNELGTVVSRSDYMPYGEEIVGLGNRTSTDKYVSNDVREGFTSYIKDDETNLDFAKNRYFDAGFGRFSNPDPTLESANTIAPQSWNRYVYVLNNPLKYIDPLGLWGVAITEIDGKKVYVFYKTQDKDDAKSLLKQLGFDPNKKKDKTAQSILKAIEGSITTIDTKEGKKDVAQLSSIGEKLQDKDTKVYGDFLKTVEEKRLAQDEHKGTGGPKDDAYYDCSLTASKLAFPNEMKNKNKDNFGLKGADKLLEDITLSSPQDKNSLRMLDVVRYGNDDNRHFGNVLFKNDSGQAMVFSRDGINGAFIVRPINDSDLTKRYGNVTGTFRPRN